MPTGSRRRRLRKRTAGVAGATSAKAPSSPWLVMLYMAGDNNLTEDMVLALQDLQASGAPHGDMIVAQLDPSGVGLSAQRYDFSTPKGKALDDYRDPDFSPSEVNTGSREALVDFIRWADDKCRVNGKKKSNYRHFLVLSGHGSGTTEDFLMKDEASGDSLTIDELKEALRAATTILQDGRAKPKKIDVLGLDACYMSMGEVAYEIRESVDVLVGAEGLEPEFGWPYGRILRRARAFVDDKASNPRGRHMTANELAAAIVEEYVEHYADYDRSAGRSVDLAAMKLDRIEKVERAFARLVGALKLLNQQSKEKKREDHEKLLLAHWYAQTYKYDQFVDLVDLCERLKIQFKGRPEIVRECTSVIEATRGGRSGATPCVIKSGCSGFATQFSHGLSIYFPWAVISADYRNLVFAEETGWREFLRTHVAATRRQPPRYPVTRALPERPSERAQALEGLLTQTLQGCRVSDVEPGVKRAILGRLSGLRCVRAAESAKAEEGVAPADVYAKALVRVAETDILDEDVPREITRRVMHAGALRDLDSRHTNHTRHTDHTRSLDDREKALKNLPPAIGSQCSPAGRGKTA